MSEVKDNITGQEENKNQTRGFADESLLICMDEGKGCTLGNGVRLQTTVMLRLPPLVTTPVFSKDVKYENLDGTVVAELCHHQTMAMALSFGLYSIKQQLLVVLKVKHKGDWHTAYLQGAYPEYSYRYVKQQDWLYKNKSLGTNGGVWRSEIFKECRSIMLNLKDDLSIKDGILEIGDIMINIESNVKLLTFK